VSTPFRGSSRPTQSRRPPQGRSSRGVNSRLSIPAGVTAVLGKLQAASALRRMFSLTKCQTAAAPRSTPAGIRLMAAAIRPSRGREAQALSQASTSGP
jgi:hypothetical protein